MSFYIVSTWDITGAQAFKSIDALAKVDENNVAKHKLSYSNDGTEIYVGSSGSTARTFGYYVGGYLGSYNLAMQIYRLWLTAFAQRSPVKWKKIMMLPISMIRLPVL